VFSIKLLFCLDCAKIYASSGSSNAPAETFRRNVGAIATAAARIDVASPAFGSLSPWPTGGGGRRAAGTYCRLKCPIYYSIRILA
jgi:hypothetical protein